MPGHGRAEQLRTVMRAVPCFCPCDSDMGLFGHDEHEDQDHCQEKRIQGNGNVLRNEPEKRRDQAASAIGGGHLYANDGLAQFLTEVDRRFVNDRRVNGRAAAADEDQPGK